jgi:hypothetical protein
MLGPHGNGTVIPPTYPLSRGERLRAKPPSFISRIFRGQLPQPMESLT